MQVIREKKSTKEEFLDGISKSLACKRSIKAIQNRAEIYHSI